MRQQALEGFRRDLGDRLAHALRKAGEEMQRQQRNVAAPLGERRQLQGDDVEAEVQILAEASLGDAFGRVAVGRGEKAHVGGDRLRAAKPVELALLQHAQQLHLHRRRHFGDFVEEQRAAGRGLDQTGLDAGGAGEGAALVAEQFVGEQFFRQCAAVDGDERPAGTPAVLVHVARQQFLARSGGADDEHVAVGRRDAGGNAEQFAHRRRVAEDLRPLAGLLERHLQCRVLALEADFLGGLAHHLAHFRQAERLFDVVEGAALHRLDRRTGVGVRGDDDHFGVRAAPARLAQQRHAVDARHAQIGEDEVVARLRQLLERRLAAIGAAGGEAFAFEHVREVVAGDRFVVDDEDARLRFSLVHRRFPESCVPAPAAPLCRCRPPPE